MEARSYSPLWFSVGYIESTPLRRPLLVFLLSRSLLKPIMAQGCFTLEHVPEPLRVELFAHILSETTYLVVNRKTDYYSPAELRWAVTRSPRRQDLHLLRNVTNKFAQ